jgi:hypothetical protein
MGSNGRDYKEPTEREEFVGAVERLNGWIRSSDELRRLLSEQQARDFDALKTEVRAEFRALRDIVRDIAHHVDEARDGIEKVREDQTDPNGFRLLRPEVQPPKDESTITLVGKLAGKVPPSRAYEVLKFGLSAGLGTAALRFIQWLTTGH